jgi:mannose-6-phosphate isomerase-like protein (cupin superfamily)
MKTTTNAKITYLISEIKDETNPRPILFLGAGCSISAGLPGVNQLCEKLKINDQDKLDVDELDKRLSGNIRGLRTQIRKAFSEPTNTTSYEMLASLIAQRYFDLILTTNWDCLLENSLSHFLSADEYRVYVREGVCDDSKIAEIIFQEVPKVKIIKLHGDILGKPIIKADDLMDLGLPLISVLENIIHNRKMIVMGYDSLNERKFMRLINHSQIYFVNPVPIDPHSLRQLGTNSVCISGPDGEFGNFVEYLTSGLLGSSYRIYTNESANASGSKVVQAKPAYKKEVKEIYNKINKHIGLSIFGEERTIELIKRMLGSILKSRGNNLAKVCLVFIQDPSAPGGEEILNLIKGHDELSSLTEGMVFQTIDVVDRYGEKRKVKTWHHEDAHTDLRQFSEVVIVDSVSFSGHTLDLVRDYLSEKGSLDKGYFQAALLAIPNRIRGKFDNWLKLICFEDIDSDFGATFPWGWTTATQHIIGDKGRVVDPFLPSGQFSFIPKPWGDCINFSNNERISVSILEFLRGQRTSTHLHLLRNETFIVLDDRIRVMIWDNFFELHKHQSVCIPAGVPHSLIALDHECRVLEISHGHFDQKKDIIRLTDPHARGQEADGSDDGFK